MAEELSGGYVRHRSEGATLLVLPSPPGFLLTELEGRMTRELSVVVEREIDSCIASHGRVSIWHDWHSMVGYDPSGRISLLQLIVARRRCVDAFCILLQLGTTAARFGARTANRVLDGAMQIYGDRLVYLAARSAAVAAGLPRTSMSSRPPARNA